MCAHVHVLAPWRVVLFKPKLQGLKNPFCAPTDELLRAKDDLLSEGGQTLSSLTEQD